MALPMFALLAPASLIPECGTLLEEKEHDRVKAASVRRLAIPEGTLLLTIWRGRLHEVIYQTPVGDDEAIKNRNALLFDAYGDGQVWNEILDNGFGKTYRRADMKLYALWSYAKDFNTFGSMDFHEVENR